MSDTENHTESDTQSVTTSQAIDTLLKEWEETVRGLRTFTVRLRALKKEVSSLEKENEKQKRSKRKKNQNGEKKISGFAIPKEISNELADFLGKEHGELVARTEVTKSLTSYIKENELYDPEHKRNIVLNGAAGEKLKAILSPLVDQEGNEVVLSYFNLQRYIRHHFPTTKSNMAAAEAAASVTPVKKTKKVVRKVVKKVATATA